MKHFGGSSSVVRAPNFKQVKDNELLVGNNQSPPQRRIPV